MFIWRSANRRGPRCNFLIGPARDRVESFGEIERLTGERTVIESGHATAPDGGIFGQSGYFLTEPEAVRDSTGIELSGFSASIGDIVTLHAIAMRGRVPR